jgi:hypothetical protein
LRRNAHDQIAVEGLVRGEILEHGQRARALERELDRAPAARGAPRSAGARRTSGARSRRSRSRRLRPGRCGGAGWPTGRRCCGRSPGSEPNARQCHSQAAISARNSTSAPASIAPQGRSGMSRTGTGCATPGGRRRSRAGCAVRSSPRAQNWK